MTLHDSQTHIYSIPLGVGEVMGHGSWVMGHQFKNVQNYRHLVIDDLRISCFIGGCVHCTKSVHKINIIYRLHGHTEMTFDDQV